MLKAFSKNLVLVTLFVSSIFLVAWAAYADDPVPAPEPTPTQAAPTSVQVIIPKAPAPLKQPMVRPPEAHQLQLEKPAPEVVIPPAPENDKKEEY